MLQDRPRLSLKSQGKTPRQKGGTVCPHTAADQVIHSLSARASMVGEVRRHVTNGSKHRTTPSVLN